MKQLFIYFFFFFVTQKVICQSWIPLGSNEQTSNSIGLTAALTFFTDVSDDGVPYISYIDDVGNGDNFGDFKVHARKLNSDHWEFAGDAVSPQFPGSDDFPLTLDGNIPYVAYSEAFFPADIRNRLTVKRLNSNTGTWEVIGQQGFSDDAATGTAITVDNDKIYVAYNDGAFNGKITVKFYDNAHSANGWQTVGTTGFSNGFVLGINIVIDNGSPYVAYRDFEDNTLVIKKFNGTIWEDVGTNSPSSGLPVVVRSLKFNSAHIPYISFADLDGAGIVRNLNAANAWVTTGDAPFATGIESPVSLVILNDIPFVAFGKKVNGITQVNVKRFNVADNSWPDAGTQPVTASTSAVNNVALLAGENNKLFAVFRNLNGGMFAKSFDAGSILPVSLTAFYASLKNNKTLLQWVTSGELDNKLFEIEYSTDGLKFEKIGEVLAIASANLNHNYSFSHSAPLGEINYYRLKQVDKNGTCAYSKIISVTLTQQSFVFTLSPNPVKDLLHVSNLKEGGKEIFISNAEGKMIRRLKTNPNSIDINVADLPKGSYFISIYGVKKIETKSFIK